MLGEIALWSFVVLLLTGIFLTLWFKPSMGEVVYNGSYDQLRGIYDVGGLRLDAGHLLRRPRRPAACGRCTTGRRCSSSPRCSCTCMRVFFTGAFRKPRELNWVIGCLLLLLGTLEGFTGYSLPDDLLSGTGIRAADGFVKSIPVVGTYMSFFLFGGEFPGDAIIPRLYTAHVLLIPGVLLALIGAHMLLLVFHKHTQWPGPGRTNENVVGYPLLPDLRRQGRRLLLHRLRRDRPDGRPADDQPGVDVRSLRPVPGHRGLPARLVHGLAGRRAADHARLGDPPVRASR